MWNVQEQEEIDFSNGSFDRFAGFDRGDLGRDDTPSAEECAAEFAAEFAEWEAEMAKFVGPLQPFSIGESYAFDASED